jgi:uncharacterized phage protein (TIGR01671 family)
MREIKFRAWNKKEKKMCRVNQINFDGFITVRFPEHESEIGDVFDDHMELDEFIVLQYTGLKDKNGQEIYEGDIVQNLRGIKNKVYWEPEISAWNCERFRDNNNRISYLMLYELADVATLEIIGNIYEGVN